jgi:hypothetical protein
LLIAGGVYAVADLVFDNVPDLHVQMDGAIFVAIPSPHDCVMRIAHTSPGMVFSGRLLVDGNWRLDYRAAVIVDASFVHMENVDIKYAALAWLIGDSTVVHPGWADPATYGVFEITIRGGQTRACIRAVEAWGANTVVRFQGAMLISGNTGDFAINPSRPAGWDTWSWEAVTSVGAIVYVDAGQLVATRATYDHPAIVIEPINTVDAAYTKPWGRVYLTGSHLEAPVHVNTRNPTAIVSADTTVAVSFANTQGYVAGDSNAVTLDATFTAGVRVAGCNFYAPPGAARTALNVASASSAAHVYVDDSSYGFNFVKGLNGVSGGIPHFTGKQIVNARQKSGQSIPSAGATVAWNTLDGNDNSSRFHAAMAGGVLTVPAGGLRDVVIDASLALSGAAPSADLQIKVNGTAIAMAPYVSSNWKSVRALLPVLNAGDTVSIFMATNTGGAIALDGSDLNRLTIMASLP